MFEWLKRLLTPKRGADEVEAQRPMGEGPAAAPVGPVTSGVPPAAPVDEPAPDEPDQPR
jgi:hypothetical protein